VQYRANGRFAGIDLPHFRGGFTFFRGGFPPQNTVWIKPWTQHVV